MKNERSSIWKLVRSLNDSSSTGLWLPNIQRPFVWSEEQIERLFDSIMREYPISTLLVWRTKSEVKHREFVADWTDDFKVSSAYVSSNEDEKGMVLDGQQRLQSLIIGIKGSYNKKELHFDLLSGKASSPEDIRYKFEFLDNKTAPWPFVRFKDILKKLSKSGVLAMDVAQEYCDKNGIDFASDAGRMVQRNIARAQQEFLNDDNISYQLLDGVDDPDAYTTEDVVEIFIRANSGGTKLGKSDLLFSLLASDWALADEEMEELLDSLNETGYGFDRDFVLKSCLVMLDQGAKYEVRKFRDPEVKNAFVNQWESLSNAIKDVRDFLFSRTYLRSDKAIPSYLGLIPLIYYRFKFPADWKRLSGGEDYILRAVLAGAFSGTPDNLIDKCVRQINERGAFLKEELFTLIRADGRNLEVTSSSIVGLRYGNKLTHLVFNLWYRDFDYSPALADNLPQQDHIFPQSFLKSVKTSNPETGRQIQRYRKDEIDQIANLALLTAKENGFQGKSGTMPAQWIPERLAEEPDFLATHLIPEDPTLWEGENYLAFIDARKKLIEERLKKYLQQTEHVEQLGNAPTMEAAI